MASVRPTSTIIPGEPLTLDQFLRLPEIDEKPYLEFINGHVEPKVSPRAKHSRIQSKLLSFLDSFAHSQRLGLAFPELRCTFAGRSIVPDVVFLTRDQIVLDAHGEPIDEIRVAPALHIEILSPGQSPQGPRERLSFTTHHGGRIGWLIDPNRREVQAFLPGQEPFVVPASIGLPVAEVLPGLSLTPANIFDWLKLDLDG